MDERLADQKPLKFDFLSKICYNIYVRKRGKEKMLSKETRKKMLENRLARLLVNGKDNGRICTKIARELRKYN